MYKSTQILFRNLLHFIEYFIKRLL